MDAEEWTEVLTNKYSPMPLNVDEEYDLCDTPHATAAQCLYLQPFGFTRKDAEFLRMIAHYIGNDFDVTAEEHADGLRSVADRIEALLPPEEK